MSCETSSDELVTWLREEIAWLREEVSDLRELLQKEQEAAALAKGGERFWREVAERSGLDRVAVAKVNARILEERRTGT